MADSIVDKIAKAPTRTKLLLLGLGLAFVGLAYRQLYYNKAAAQKKSVETALAGLQAQEVSLAEEITKLGSIPDQESELHESQKTLDKALPQEAQLPRYFRNLRSRATMAGVDLVSSAPDKEVIVENLVKVPVNIEVRGEYQAVNQYFWLLAQKDMGRIVTIENLKIGGLERLDGRYVVKARFTASTFREADKSEQQGGKK